MQTMTFDTH